MTVTADTPQLTEAFSALLRGEAVSWDRLGASPEELIDACADQDLLGLVHRRLRALDGHDWPPLVALELERAAGAQTAREMLRRRELIAALQALESSGIHPILFKGTALAYSTYGAPDLRPRNDTDLLIQRDQIDTVRRILEDRGYREPAYCEGELLFCQFELQKNDEFGVLHALDFHWKISTQTLFAGLLTLEDLERECVPVTALGPNARAPGTLHALLLACVHPVMHHRNAEHLIWLYDVHLLALRLPPGDWHRLVELAATKGVAAICAHQLASARKHLGTTVPDGVIEQLHEGGSSERTVLYLRPDRRWHDELVSNVHGLPGWGDRARLLREVAFPNPAYMLKAYGLPDRPLNRTLLPLLYAHRGVRGVLKVLRGSK